MTCTLRREWGYALRKRWSRDQLSARYCTIVCLLETHSAIAWTYSVLFLMKLCKPQWVESKLLLKLYILQYCESTLLLKLCTVGGVHIINGAMYITVGGVHIVTPRVCILSLYLLWRFTFSYHVVALPLHCLSSWGILLFCFKLLQSEIFNLVPALMLDFFSILTQVRRACSQGIKD